MIGLAVRQLRFGAAAIIAVTAGMSALVAAQYQTTFAGALDHGALRALAANPAIRTLFGEPVALGDPGGFTVWRTGTPVGVLVGVWAALTATRLTRGDEDAGRLDLLLSGTITARGLLARRLAVLAGAVTLSGTGVSLALLVTGTAPAGAVLHGAGIAALGLVFAAVGALTAQLLPSRSPATGAAVGVLGAALLARMVTDGIDAPAWVRWLTPFGLTGQLQPYAANRVAPLAGLAALAVVLAAAAILAAGRRDLRSAPLALDARRRARTRLLHSLIGFALRRALRPWTGWLFGVAAYFALIGSLTTSISEFLSDNTRFSELAAGAGFGGLGSPHGFAATMFSLLAIPTGVYAAVRIGSFAEDETSRRATLLFAMPFSRRKLLGCELAITTAGTLLLATGAGLALWAGAAAAGAPLGFTAAIHGALNITPIALLSLGAAIAGLGRLPRATVALGALPAVGGFFYQVVAQSAGAPDWVLGFSPFTHTAAVPLATPDWPGSAGLLTVAAVLTAVGTIGYTRRDLAI
ncbi:ABC transporter permease [Amycolatopsis magusensis]|uniref:ABC-2 type transport system permease protein n=1 Tax=Amycolatopsis magusensis TaxID=882444 RepID=A0ABS4PW34_9PSEU|nr:polyketide antibiotic transporter [Amycolatopsis magusensis]MBP2183642.1 ABC-2 type transport system permease protein [Amycolatopsis magusensis]